MLCNPLLLFFVYTLFSYIQERYHSSSTCYVESITKSKNPGIFCPSGKFSGKLSGKFSGNPGNFCPGEKFPENFPNCQNFPEIPDELLLKIYTFFIIFALETRVSGFFVKFSRKSDDQNSGFFQFPLWKRLKKLTF
jgi:hypothetical protein